MSIYLDSIMLSNSKLIVFVMADVQFNLRIPEELKEMVKDAAKLSGRSINAEAQYRLELSFQNTNKQLDDLTADELIFFIFNKLNSRGLHLTVEEIQRAKESKKAP